MTTRRRYVATANRWTDDPYLRHRTIERVKATPPEELRSYLSAGSLRQLGFRFDDKGELIAAPGWYPTFWSPDCPQHEGAA